MTVGICSGACRLGECDCQSTELELLLAESLMETDGQCRYCLKLYADHWTEDEVVRHSKAYENAVAFAARLRKKYGVDDVRLN